LPTTQGFFSELDDFAEELLDFAFELLESSQFLQTDEEDSSSELDAELLLLLSPQATKSANNTEMNK
jgi:hypothetical protein